ncbi:hypothetical protein Tco_0918027 [Tanacetum coccineum]
MAKSSSHNPSSPEITPKEEPVTLDKPESPNPFLPVDQIKFSLMRLPSPPTMKASTQYKEYMCEFWYTTKTLDDSMIWVSTPIGGIRGDICITTFRNALRAHYLSHSSMYVPPPSITIVEATDGSNHLVFTWENRCLYQIYNKDATILYCMANGVKVDYAKLIWEDIIHKLNKKTREKVVPYPRFISLLRDYIMPEYDNEELTINHTHVFNVHNWALKLNQTEGPRFTDHIKVLNHFKVHISHFNPFGMIKLTTFAVICKAYGGEPSVDLLRSFLNLGRAGDWLTLSSRGGADGGLDENRSSMKYVNNEALVINAEPISAVHPLDITKNIMDSLGKRSKVAGKRKAVVGSHGEDPHRKARKVPAQASKVADDTSTPLDVDSDPDIHDKPDPSTVCNFTSIKELKDATDCYWVVAHVTPPSWKQYLREISIEHLCDIHENAYLRQAVLDNILNGRTRELISALRKARASYVDSLRQDRAVVVARVIPDAVMKLIRSDEMEEMPDYRPSSKEEYYRAGNDLADASYPFLVELNADPHASIKQLLSKKPQSLQSKHLFSKAS